MSTQESMTEAWRDKPRYRFGLYSLNSNSVGNYEPVMAFGEGYTNRATLFVFGYMLFIWFYYSIFASIEYITLGIIGVIWFTLPDLIIFIYFKNSIFLIRDKNLILKYPFRSTYEINFRNIIDITVLKETKNYKSLLIRYADNNRQLKKIKLLNPKDYKTAIDLFIESGKIVRIKKS